MPVDFYQSQFTVTENECDMEKRMMPGAILRRVQQISTDQCTSLGITSDIYERTQTAFLLAKTVLEVYAPITADTPITMITRPSAPKRAVYFRYTTLQNAAGEVLAAADSRWVLVDTVARRILRKAPKEIEACFLASPEKELNMAIHTTNTTVSGKETASYTRCDKNHHLNNTVYADIICDYLPLEILREKYPTRIAITYHKEVAQGKSFALHSGMTEAGSYYFCGKNGDVNHFEAEVYLDFLKR